ncbi:MAG: type II secretion system protein [Acidobacteria bacterium]|nr:type II secretion system protein [Acidobacteriota bacterium]MBM3768856.1 type II secretion system protein [Acidobacteriota bacterium]
MTLVELIVAFSILLLLSTMALPLARSRVRREKEKELRIALREMRTAIDKYKDMADAGQLGQLNAAKDGYPESLEVLVEGVKVQAQAGQGGAASANLGVGQGTGNGGSTGSDSSEKKVRFLRRIPKDPFTGSTEWGKRSTQDDPKSTAWGGQNVFDVFSKTMEKAADGTPYSEW